MFLPFCLSSDIESCKSADSGYNENMPSPMPIPRIFSLDLYPFVGKYIAIVEGRVVAVSDSARGAFFRARRVRPKRMPVIVKVADSDRTPTSQHLLLPVVLVRMIR